jgi:hypothetical protein
MKMKFGAIVVDGRGKIGGHVASKNRGGAYLRTKVTPVNGQTSFQNGVRNLFTALSQEWRALTEEQRLAWNAAVADYQRTNIFGDTHSPTGFNLFQRLNNNLTNVGGTVIPTPLLPAAVSPVSASSLTAVSGTQSMSLVLNAELDDNTAVKVFATAPVSAGKSFVKSQYRQISVLAPEATTPVNLLSAYQDKFGSTGIAGQKIFVKVVAINFTTGQEGTPSSISAIVTPSA